MLVVMHPDLQNTLPDTNFITKLLHNSLILLLHPPAHLIREQIHLILLILRELGPEPLLHASMMMVAEVIMTVVVGIAIWVIGLGETRA